ncbi:hypothetical protein ACWEKM_24970 [Streptomyces sp. NPDC004752]
MTGDRTRRTVSARSARTARTSKSATITKSVTVVTAAVLAAVAGLSGCADNGTTSPSGAASEAASAAASIASEAAGAFASATADVGRRLDEIKSGIDVTGDVALGPPATAADGRTTVELTVHNTARSARSFVVQVTFDDPGGNLLDTVVVTVPDVGANRTARATARSTHTLSGKVKPTVARAIRY